MKKIAIIGGGQLAKMTLQVAQQWGFETSCLDPDEKAPARYVSNHFVHASFDDQKAMAELAEYNDCISFDLENIDVTSFDQKSQFYKKCFPKPHTLQLIQNKLLQKQFLIEKGFPVSKLIEFENIGENIFPCVWKAQTGGYDGKGVSVVNSLEDLKKLEHVDFLLEEKIDIKTEFAVQVARNQSGDLVAYPCVDMLMDSEHKLDYLQFPSDLPSKLQDEAMDIAKNIVKSLDGVGIFAIEFFLDHDNAILINEIAPRPHNSGHHTIEACNVSQFEQHLRAVSNLSLKQPIMSSPCCLMYNLIGEGDKIGPVFLEGFDEAMTFDNVYVHVYGKKIHKPGRKMGHVTITGNSMQECFEVKQKLEISLKITAKI